ncbi:MULTISPECIES: CaiB/BaiF CoA transferase family protein [Nocardia]|jgi:crotonobetainyl-CoA:carnitine CoA-transferase CaiB-like acyl-CoA transferase|uniref:CaiB/BaiF CoA transferase family protein n=1 Tax=Nocardia abscessus TaxID=120957 RepID=UPI0018955953|nr:CoA transferase [Nocardia abscessus]MBF6472439.1 CoA transferase [Nocardia abscessus]
MTEFDAVEGPLAGIRVLDLTLTLPGAMATQFLADGGADVLMIEPIGGSPLRTTAGWPGLARGKRSLELDLRDSENHDRLRELVAESDVVLTALRPATAERLGLTPARFAAWNPRVVSAAVTGFGARGPLAHIKGYEGLVMGKFGFYQSLHDATPRPGQAFISTPYASWGAAHTVVHGILAALYEREFSGHGQHVEADLIRGVATMDTYNWFKELVGQRWPGAFANMGGPWDDRARPQARLIYSLLIAPTKDGVWLQFAQIQPRLFKAFIEELGLAEELAKPKWEGMPDFPDVERRVELWEIMIEKVRARTYAEWEQVFDRNPNISAQGFRSPAEALNHPQLQHEGRVAVIENPELGPVRQPSTMIQVDGHALVPLRPAPRLNEHADRAPAKAPVSDAPAEPPAGLLPLTGVTVLEFGMMFAAPYGATLLTDLGARVIKVESLEGDEIRRLVAFPEAGGSKVLQGKESVAIDISTPEGREIVHRLAERADIVLQSFRAGAAARAGVDAETLKAINPDLIYLNAPGYGTDGPFGGAPAYAPSIGAASGLALSSVPGAAGSTETLDEIKRSIPALHTGGMNQSVQADGVAALGVASALLLGLLARRRGRPVGTMTTTMLASSTVALMDRNLSYEGMPEIPEPDPELYGLSPLYRLYRAADGWIFLAAPAEREWDSLVRGLRPWTDLSGDDRFGTVAERRAHADALSGVLAQVFAQRPKQAWEDDLTLADIGCVACADEVPESNLQSDEGFALGLSTEAVSPVFDEYRRLAPATTFSRSAVKADSSCLIGQHTDAILTEMGIGPDRIAELRERRIVG